MEGGDGGMGEGKGRMAEGKGGVVREYETTRREIEGVEGKVVIKLVFISYGCGKNDLHDRSST
jgi:hypothetical protein